MEKQVKEILKKNGYQVSDKANLSDMIKMINQWQSIIGMLDDAKIFIPSKRKTLDF